jgi:hypothetical protein
MSIAANRLVRALALDLDVDTALPGRHALDTGAGSQKPTPPGIRAASTALRSVASPVTPIPAILASAPASRRRASISSAEVHRLGDQNIDFARVERIEIERDVHGVRVGERCDRSSRRSPPVP